MSIDNKKGDETMNNLIPIRQEGTEQRVSGRDLHMFLEVGAHYKDWFPRMCEYGFIEGRDFNPLNFERVQTEGSREVVRTITDHLLSIDMAKQICMLARNEKGKQAREYFIDVEKNWNSPEMILNRALEYSRQMVAKQQETIAIQSQQIAELQPKASYYDVVLNCKDLVAISTIAKDFGLSAQGLNKILNEKKVQYKQGDIWLLYQKYAPLGYTSSKTQSYNGSDGEVHTKLHTYWTQKGRLFIYSLLKEEGIYPLIELN